MALTQATLVQYYSNINLGDAPSAADAAFLGALAAQTQQGAISDADAISRLIELYANDTTKVAIATYQYFTGEAPSQAGLKFLVGGDSNETGPLANTQDLNDAYYAQFNQENRFYNFAANLALFSPDAADVEEIYGDLSYDQAVDLAYEEIVGAAAAQAAGIDVAVAKAYLKSDAVENYLTARAAELMPTEDQGYAKNVLLIGFLLNEAVKGDVGRYADSIDQMVRDLLVDGALTDPSSQDLFEAYPPGSLPGVPVFAVTPGTLGSADVARLSGNTDVRVDFTNPANQLVGRDLDNDGVIENDGVENAVTGVMANYEVVDAYARNRLNEGDSANNFLGDLRFDGTAFDGDGVNTDGNIVLGGLGADRIFTGVGNDFLTGGGVSSARQAQDLNGDGVADGDGFDLLSGGRNADFFFVELSALDPTDGDNTVIDGGSTGDDATPTESGFQDSDWLLLEASDDDEPVQINLENYNTAAVEDGFILAQASGKEVDLTNVENVDASGDFYAFLDGLDVRLGARGATVDPSGNDGIGSSAQLIIIGSDNDNILIGGYDNDDISGEDGNDTLFGGNLRKLINPNLLAIPDDGMDNLLGGAGDDALAFETDGGTYDGDGSLVGGPTGGNDTLFLTEVTFGANTGADDVTTDGVVRLDLLAVNINNAAGYGGADINGTADQTNYLNGFSNATVVNMENINASGLGAIDYDADGANDSEVNDLDLNKVDAFEGDLDLRGSNDDNILLSSSGNDTVEGREGNDTMMGAAGNDRFQVQLDGDGLDAIQVAVDADADGVWDGYDRLTGQGLWGRDFGLNPVSNVQPSTLLISVGPNGLDVSDIVEIRSAILLQGGGSIPFSVSGAAVEGAATYAELAAAVQAQLDANANPEVQGLVVTAVGDSIVITDPGGRSLADSASEGGQLIVSVEPNETVQNIFTAEVLPPTVSQDVLEFVAYEDRADGERVNDDNTIDAVGDATSLGEVNYAEDLVVSFNPNARYVGADGETAVGGTTLTQGQTYQATFTNLAEDDFVSIVINGVTYSAQVGLNPDGTAAAGDYNNGNGSFEGFLQRFAALINAADDDTRAGTLAVATADLDGDGEDETLVFDQGNGVGSGESVFMETPVIVLGNASGGEAASVVVTETSDTSVFLNGFDGRNGGLNGANVEFVGAAGVNRSILATATNAGGLLEGLDAITVDTKGDVDTVANDFSLHGDDLLIGGAGNDTINAKTGDDRVFASRGLDVVDGGADHYVVTATGEVVVRNEFQAVAGATAINENGAAGPQDGYVDTLVVQQSDFGAGASFTINLNAGIVSTPADVAVQQAGISGTVVLDGAAATNTTTFSNFEAVRTVSGDQSLAGQGRDTLNLAALSNAALANAAANTAGALGAGINYNLATGQVVVNGDLDNVDGTLESRNLGNLNLNGIAGTFAVTGVETVVGGNGDDTVTVDEAEIGKDNRFALANETLAASGAGDTVAYDFTGYAFAASVTTTINVEVAAETDTVVFSGVPTAIYNGGNNVAATDTLVDVETISMGANVAAGDDDTLNLGGVNGVGGVTGGAVVNYGGTVNLGESVSGIDGADTQNGVANIDLLAGGGISSATSMGTELLILDNIDAFEVVTGTAAADRVIVGNDVDMQSGTAALDELIYTFNLAGGTDTLDYRNENEQLVYRISTDATDTDTIAVDDGVVGLRDTAISVEQYIVGGSGDVINLDGATVDTTITLTGINNVADPNGEAVPLPVPPAVLPGFATTVAATTGGQEFARFLENLTGAPGFVTGIDASSSANAERVVFNDRSWANAYTIQLGAGANVVDASAVDEATPTNLTLEAFADATELDRSHAFGASTIETAANSLTVIASEESLADTVDVSDLANELPVGAPVGTTKATRVDLAAGTVSELVISPAGAETVANLVNIDNFENVVGSAGVDTVSGNEAENNITGGAGNDLISGGGGADTIDAGADNDTVSGGDGSDSLAGGLGADSVVGGAGQDSLNGGDGNDELTGGAAADVITAGLGADRININTIAESDDDTAPGTADAITDFTAADDDLVFTVSDSSTLTVAYTETGAVDAPANVDADAVADDVRVEIEFGGTGTDYEVYLLDRAVADVSPADIVARITQSVGADAQDVGAFDAAGIQTEAVYTSQSQSTLGQRDVFDNANFDTFTLDFRSFGFDTGDSDGDGFVNQDIDEDGVVELDELIRVDVPVSVDNADTLADFFSVTREVGDPDQAGVDVFDVRFVLQSEQGTSNYRLFVDVNGDGNFTAAADMVIDFTNEANSAGGLTEAQIYDLIDNVADAGVTETATYDLFLI